MNQRERAAVGIGFITLIIALTFTSYMVFYNGGVMYELGLEEGMEINKDDTPFAATVYWYVNGEFIWSEHNVITNVGLNASRHHLCDETWVNNNATTHAFRYLNIGTGNGGGASSTNLTTYFDGQIATFAEVMGVSGNFTMTYTWSAGSFSGETIQEAGMSNLDLSDGTAILLNYQDFTGITLQSTDSLQIQFMFQISSG